MGFQNKWSMNFRNLVRDLLETFYAVPDAPRRDHSAKRPVEMIPQNIALGNRDYASGNPRTNNRVPPRTWRERIRYLTQKQELHALEFGKPTYITHEKTSLPGVAGLLSRLICLSVPTFVRKVPGDQEDPIILPKPGDNRGV